MKPRRIRWLHLSDFHVGQDDYAQRKLSDRILEHVRSQIAAGKIPDLIFLTGDLANRGKSTEYDTFFEEFVDPLVTMIPGRPQLFAVPGNHDCDRDWMPYFSREEITQPGSRFFDASDPGHKSREPLLRRFAAYASFDKDATNASPGWLQSREGAYAVATEIAGQRVGIVGLNTAWMSKNDTDRHQLTPGVALLEDALRRVRDCAVHIVLGHHPIDWFTDESAEQISAILGLYQAVYLHGHMHRARSKRDEGAGKGFLTVQGGAAFQARDDEKWINGLVWGELDLGEKQLWLQPRHWSPLNRDWPLTSGSYPESRRSGDFWVFNLPAAESTAAQSGGALKPLPTEVPFVPPEGWALVDLAYLNERRRPMTQEEAIDYFNGSLPSWMVALCPEIPRRAVVSRLVAMLTGHRNQHRPLILQLLGPGGEGKSTIILQAAVALLEQEPSARILWRYDSGAHLPLAQVLALPTNTPWLLMTDEAEDIAKDCLDAAKALHAQSRGDIRFLLTGRRSDWVREGCDALPWRLYADVREESLHGLTPEDSALIVQAWSQYGAEGLGRLANVDLEEAAERLVRAAQQEAATNDGSFLGAMLSVRIGDTLKEHVRLLLTKIEGIAVSSTQTLLDAFADIAVMHAENLLFLSKPVLAQSLGCRIGELHSRVIRRLGREALVARSGQYVLCRHRRIAEVAVELLQDAFGYDIDDVFIHLVKSAMSAAQDSFIPNFPKWNSSIIHHFIPGNSTLAYKLAAEVYEYNPHNAVSLIIFCKILRDVGQPRKAALMFRAFEKERRTPAVYCEWGIAERNCGKYALAACLLTFTLTDKISIQPINNQRAKVALSVLSQSFSELYEKFHRRIFLDARTAAAQLGLMLFLDEISLGIFTGYTAGAGGETVKEPSIADALQAVQAGFEEAWECREEELPELVFSPKAMKYSSLSRLCLDSLQRKLTTATPLEPLPARSEERAEAEEDEDISPIEFAE